MAKRLLPVDIIAVGCYPNEYRNELRERMAAIMAEEIGCGRAHLINGFELKEGEEGCPALRRYGGDKGGREPEQAVCPLCQEGGGDAKL